MNDALREVGVTRNAAETKKCSSDQTSIAIFVSISYKLEDIES